MAVDNKGFSAIRRAQELISNRFGRAATLDETFAFLAEEYVEQHDPVKKAERARNPSKVIHQVHLRDQQRCQAISIKKGQCTERRWLHVHHRLPRSEGGKDTIDNLVTLCSFHHRMFHRSYPSRDG
jgi:5-methylcytosine-specific restriction endonuclease McrA